MTRKFKIFNATELWQKETLLPTIPTFSQRLDNALGSDGIELGTVTELFGLPGSGKTQLCLQLCASVQIPKALGGLEAEALFIDTNINFTIHRFKEILGSSLEKFQKLIGGTYNINVKTALKKLHYVNAFGLEKFCAFMYLLPNYLKKNRTLKLVVIDSIIFPFKEGVTPQQRTGVLFRILAELQKCTFENQVALVVTNEMSTRVGLSSGVVVGALGDAWPTRCNTRVLLSSCEGSEERHAMVVKSRLAGPQAVAFRITKEGIRDID